MPLLARKDADRSECENRRLADPTAAELDVPDDPAVFLRHQRERAVQVPDRFDDPRFLVRAERRPLDLEGSFSVSGCLRADPKGHDLPVEPNPLSPRLEGGSSSTQPGRRSGTSTTTSCAIRSPREILTLSWGSRFTTEQINSPR
jgi:hypothetical protein